MHAVLVDRNQQYRVAPGDRLTIALDTSLEEGATVIFDRVCYLSGDQPKVGSPYVKGASVVAKVLRQNLKGPKLIVQKFKRRKNYRRRVGHRSHYTELLIESILPDPEG